MRNVLIVDDSNDYIFLTKALLNLNDSDVSVASTVAEATTQLETKNFQVVITDYNFPIGGFPALLPVLQNKAQSYILQSSDPSIIKTYDPNLQLGALTKGTNYVAGMRSLLKNLKI
jgi:DNA-binding NtrC family response regulator